MYIVHRLYNWLVCGRGGGCLQRKALFSRACCISRFRAKTRTRIDSFLYSHLTRARVCANGCCCSLCVCDNWQSHRVTNKITAPLVYREDSYDSDVCQCPCACVFDGFCETNKFQTKTDTLPFYRSSDFCLVNLNFTANRSWDWRLHTTNNNNNSHIFFLHCIDSELVIIRFVISFIFDYLLLSILITTKANSANTDYKEKRNEKWREKFT